MPNHSDPDGKDFRLGEFLVQPQLNRISRNGETSQIEPKIMRVLLCLADRPGQVVTREQLLDSVWGDVFVSEQVLSRSISELRKVLADDSRAQNIIETIPKTGYRLVAPILPPTNQPDESTAFLPETSPETSPETLPEALPASVVSPPAPASATARSWGLPATIAALALLLIAMVWLWRRIELEATGPVLRLTLDLAETIPAELDLFESMAVAPDGRHLVYVARREGKYHLFRRALDQSEATPIPGAEGGYGPFFSPDGNWLGFYAGGQLKKIPVEGGAASTLGTLADDAVGASWGEDGSIVYVRRFFEGLYRVHSGGGAPEPLTTLDSERGERSHFWPEVLPGGNAVIYTVWDGGAIDQARIVALSLRTKERKTLVEGAARARYLSTGHLVYVRRGQLIVAPFDAARLEVTGPAAIRPERVGMSSLSGAAHYAISRSGLLVYLPFRVRREDLRLLWVDRRGEAQQESETARGYAAPRISPGGDRLVFAQLGGEGADLWVKELSGGALRRLTFDRLNSVPVWTPDGHRLVFSSDAHGGSFNLYWKSADGGDAAERLTESGNAQFPGSWSPDGRYLVFSEVDPKTRWDIWLLDLQANERRPRPWLQTGDDDMQPILSPDGRYLAYTSSETGKWQVFVRSFPEPGGKWQISTEGGTEPRWRRDGRELYFRTSDHVWAVGITPGPRFEAGRPQPIVTGRYRLDTVSMLPTYDVSPDGARFLMLRSDSEDQPTRLSVVLNWMTELTR